MTWLVQYRDAATDRLAGYPSPEEAIKAACGLLDNGYDVYRIGMESLDDSIEKDQITRICAIRVKARVPFGRSAH
jgi:hypothetical protein